MQEQDFEQKVAMLRREFPQVNGDQVHHFLETAQGNSDVAYSMLLEDVDNLVQQVCSPTPFVATVSVSSVGCHACNTAHVPVTLLPTPSVVEAWFLCLSVYTHSPNTSPSTSILSQCGYDLKSVVLAQRLVVV